MPFFERESILKFQIKIFCKGFVLFGVVVALDITNVYFFDYGFVWCSLSEFSHNAYLIFSLAVINFGSTMC